MKTKAHYEKPGRPSLATALDMLEAELEGLAQWAETLADPGNDAADVRRAKIIRRGLGRLHDELAELDAEEGDADAT